MGALQLSFHAYGQSCPRVAVAPARPSPSLSVPIPSLPLGLELGGGVPGVAGGMKACVELVTAAAAATKRTEDAQDGMVRWLW